MHVFREKDLYDFLEGVKETLKQEVLEQKDLLSMDQAGYVEYLVSKYSLAPLTFGFDEVSASESEHMVRVGSRAFDYGMSPHDTIRQQVITYHLPVGGDTVLLEMRPDSGLPWSMEVELSGNNELSFDIRPIDPSAAGTKREADRCLENLRSLSRSVNTQVEAHNQALRQLAERHIQSRRETLLQRSNVLESLGVPIRRRGQPSSFTVPVQKRRVAIAKPASAASPYKPEPELARAEYDEILRICFDTGREMERHEGWHHGKGEEILRDHFLITLASHYENTTGETFNKQGKTDILIRHEGSNVFVAECKFWTGAKGYFDAINQLLGYLTWRDSKVTLLLFISNKQLEPVLQQIVEETPKHPCFVRSDGKIREGYYGFRFRLPNDETRGVILTVICFHFPE